MALINCPECGHQMSDAAKKCPHCGYQRKKATVINPKIIGFISFGIGICLLIISVGLILNFYIGPICYEVEDFRVGIIITFSTILGLFIIASFIKKHIPKALKIVTLISLIDIILISLLFAFLGLESREQSHERVFGRETNTYENQMEQTDNSQKYISTSDYYGTYEYIQPQNQDGIQSLKLVINPDKTVQAIINKNGTEIIAYGSIWYEYNNGFVLRFNDTEEHINGILYIDHLRVYRNFSKYFGIKYGYIKYDKDEEKLYLYEDKNHGDAKDPTKRVELQKIE